MKQLGKIRRRLGRSTSSLVDCEYVRTTNSIDRPSYVTVTVKKLWRPHSPFTAPQRFFDQYPLEDIQLPPVYVEADLEDLGKVAQRQLDPWDRWPNSGSCLTLC